MTVLAGLGVIRFFGAENDFLMVIRVFVLWISKGKPDVFALNELWQRCLLLVLAP